MIQSQKLCVSVLLCVLLFPLSAESVKADGKFYTGESIPPEIPYQRAILVFDKGQETLLIQSKFKQQPGSKQALTTGSVGWVIPVPAEPEIATIHPDAAMMSFLFLNRRARPFVTNIISGSLSWFAFLIILAYIFSLVLGAEPVTAGRHQWLISHRKFLRIAAIVSAVFIIFSYLIPPLGSSAGKADVEVLKSQKVGIYDVKVVRSADPDAMYNWLRAGGFAFDDSDKETIANYVTKGWCFAAAVVDPNTQINIKSQTKSTSQKTAASTATRSSENVTTSRGLIAPIVLRFRTDKPVYPLSLTACAGSKTKILLYVAAPKKVSCNGRLKLRFADKYNLSGIYKYIKYCKPESFADTIDEGDSPGFLCKFRGTLTPQQMRDDIVFTLTDNQQPYQEHIYRWR